MVMCVSAIISFNDIPKVRYRRYRLVKSKSTKIHIIDNPCNHLNLLEITSHCRLVIRVYTSQDLVCVKPSGSH